MKFPVSPATGQQFKPSESHPTYVWNGVAWKVYSNIQGAPGLTGSVGATGATGAQGPPGENSFFYQSTVPATGLHKGAIWFNSDTLITYAYVYDGTNYFWVQINN
jgi:hypothetical protein